MTLLASQPFKGLYALAATTFTLATLPLWLLRYITKYGRQHPAWSFRQSLAVRALFSFVYHSAKVQVKTPLPLSPGKEKDRFVVIKAREENKKLFRGPLARDKDVQAQDVGATWYKSVVREGDKVDDVLVVLHIHGGAYVIGDGRQEATGFLASTLLKNTPATHVLAPQYRLSTLPVSPKSNPFPAALQDSLTSYLYLLRELKIPAKNIVLSGDSAGANNAIALLRYLAEYGAEDGIPPPSAAWLWSPWVNPTDNTDALIHSPHYSTDYIPAPFIAWGGKAYCGAAGPAALATDPYVNVKAKGFKTPTPLWVNAGAVEVLYFDIKEWSDLMLSEGNSLVLDLEDGAPHDILLLGAMLGFQKAAAGCAKRAAEWLTEARK